MKIYQIIIVAAFFVLFAQIPAMADNLPTLSQEAAIAIARRLVGADTLEAIPYSDSNSAHQFIGVLAQDPDAICCPYEAKIYVLEGIGQTFKIHKTELTTVREFSDIIPENLSHENLSKIARWGVIDIDNDGIHEIFSIGLSYGSGGGSYSIQLYDSSSQQANIVRIDFAWGKPPGLSEFIINSKSKKDTISNWLLEKLNELTDNIGLINKQDEIFIWEQNNGTGFYNGKVKLHEVEGSIDVGASLVCEVKDGDFRWLSYFKESVYGYNQKRNIHFLLYSPSNSYEWIGKIIASKTYVWFGITVPDDKYNLTKRSLIVYNKTNGNLELIKVPGLGQILCSKLSIDCGSDPDSISKGFLMKNSKLTVFGKALKLPAFIKADEFKGATQCE